jgi:altronate dehydratase small subunit
MAASETLKRGFQVHPADTVAVVLEDAGAGPSALLGSRTGTVHLAEPIALGHKVAVAEVAEGQPVKFGVPIGIATQPIPAAAWVHLHNCRSLMDERSSTADVATGPVTDTPHD